MARSAGSVAKNLKICVLDAFTVDQGTLSWDRLRSLGTLQLYERSSRAEAVERIQGCHVVLSNKALVDLSPQASPLLRYVGKLATGYNDIDTALAKQRGIAVTNVAGYSTPSVVQLVLSYMLHSAVRVATHFDSVKRGEWAASKDFWYDAHPSGLHELAGRTLVIVGTGAIGAGVKQVAEALGMRVLSAQVPGRPASSDRIPLDAALAQADFVSLHCPLTPATTRLVDATFLSKCKRGAVLINTGRGPLVDEAALVNALDQGILKAAYLDVLSVEPPADGASRHLIAHPKAFVTPHIGWASAEARERLLNEAVDNLEAWLQGRDRNRVA